MMAFQATLGNSRVQAFSNAEDGACSHLPADLFSDSICILLRSCASSKASSVAIPFFFKVCSKNGSPALLPV